MGTKMILKLVATAAMVVILLQLQGVTFYFAALLFTLAAILLWVLPAQMARYKKNLDPGFQTAFEHDHIALDTTNRRLWIRDPARGQRYLEPGDISTIRTGLESVRGGRVHQRIEFQIHDLEHPVWHVWFDRHSESRLKGSNRNSHERDEWYARIKTWAGLKNMH
ncbi:hypothetical protein [Novilysobacter spongiicola]|uniref:Uncharacterized protein n=1 Tax=Lysobacter spongiicola DSM 21749 TaxID=1122188 RepID=A0A1T4RFC9_9GAMM|nr:hypothetical protein [Lysobacter spongiicola]SKA14730.1 hypothetical protein SAMN02745674_02158 [Lysobacter spongiicola DSM 21749]